MTDDEEVQFRNSMYDAPKPKEKPPPLDTPEGQWALARGFDLKAPHWDDLDEVMREQVRRIVRNVRCTITDPSIGELPTRARVD